MAYNDTSNIPMYTGIFHHKWKDLTFVWYSDGYKTAYKTKHTFYTPNPGEHNSIDCGMKDIYGKAVYACLVNGEDERDIKKANEGPDNILSECDIEFTTRFLERHYKDVKELRFNRDDFNICFLDIEVESGKSFPTAKKAKERINCITIYLTKKKQYITFGLQKYINDETKAKIEKIKGEYRRYDTEKELITDLFTTIGTSEIDIISGWNINNYDIPFLVNRARFLDVELKLLSRLPDQYKTAYWNPKEFELTIGGTDIVDYYLLYKKAARGETDNNKLNTIAKHEGLGEKAPLPEGYQSYKNYWDDYVYYNITDVEILVKLDEKKRMLEGLIGACCEARVPFSHFFAAKKMLVGFILTVLHSMNIVMPPLKYNDRKQFPGAFVYANPGRYETLVSYDYRSMYPSLIMGANISPDTKVVFDINYKLTDEEKRTLVKSPWTNHGTKQVYYRRDKDGVVPIVIRKLFLGRDVLKKESKKAKKEGRDNDAAYYYMKEQSYKLFGNSFYGLLGNPHFQLYDLDNAASVTGFGAELILDTVKKLQTYFRTDLMKDTKYFEAFKKYPSLNTSYNTETRFTTKDSDAAFDIATRYSHGDTDSFFVRYDDLYKDFKQYLGKQVSVIYIKGDKIIEESIYDLQTKEHESKLDFNKKCTQLCPSWKDLEVERKKKVFTEGLYIDGDVRIIYNRYCLTDYSRILDAVLMENLLSNIMQNFANFWNFKENTLFLKREKCINSAIVTTKKKYVCLIESNEDVKYAVPEFSTTGIEIIRSSTLPFAREHIKELVLELLKNPTKHEIQEKYLNIKKQFYEFVKSKDIYSISIPSGVGSNPPTLIRRTISKEDLKILDENKTPYIFIEDITSRKEMWNKLDWRMRSAAIWNFLLEDESENTALSALTLEPIYEGSKAKFLKVLPNKYGVSSVAYSGETCPKELLNIFQVDWDEQWQAGFSTVMSRLFKAIGWGEDIENDRRDLMAELF